MPKIRVVLADDHAILRSGLKALLNAQPDIEVVGEAENGSEALRQARELSPDLLVLDMTMPGGGIPLIEELRRVRPEVRILVLTMHDDAALARATLGAGAAGYIVKAAADVELMTAVRAVHRGRTFVDLDWGSEQGRASPGAPTPGFAGASRTARLSRREREVLSLLAQGHTNQEIAQRLDVSVKTVETYRARISNKFGLRSRADLVRFAIETGLLGPKTFA